MDARFRFSTDPSDIDRERVHRWLSEQSYWALGRARDVQDAAMDASRNYAVVDTGSDTATATATATQVAYARVVTDGVTFAWLCDVFVDPDVRGRGVGVALIEGVVADLEPLGLRRIALATADAHGLYEKFGFAPLSQPERWMALLPG
jgi:GNAT superfamily N-acetyltransferase